jgi:hypothetical protein
MSRRREGPEAVYKPDAFMEWHCAGCMRRDGVPNRLGGVIRHERPPADKPPAGFPPEEWAEYLARNVRDMLVGEELQVVPGDDGKPSKVVAACSACRNAGSDFAPQVRWDRLVAMLDEMDATGQRRRAFTPR